MKIQSRATIHAGVGFTMSPFDLDRGRLFEFQQRLMNIDGNFSQFIMDESKFVAIRSVPVPTVLEVRLTLLPAPNVGQLVIVATNRIPSTDSFTSTATFIVQAYEEVWSFTPRQVLSSDVTLRDLYDTEHPHAFKEIWEQRLQRTSDELRVFDQPVIGGGVRFVLAPKQEDEPLVDLRIESQLDNPGKIFIELQASWQKPTQGNPLNPAERFDYVQKFEKERTVQWFSVEPKT